MISLRAEFGSQFQFLLWLFQWQSESRDKTGRTADMSLRFFNCSHLCSKETSGKILWSDANTEQMLQLGWTGSRSVSWWEMCSLDLTGIWGGEGWGDAGGSTEGQCLCWWQAQKWHCQRAAPSVSAQLGLRCSWSTWLYPRPGWFDD